MRTITLFIAMSLDGYIADAQGGVGWLAGHGEEQEPVDSYSAFIQDIDTVVMGWNTYHQIVTQLSPGAWPYDSLTTYVLTHRPLPSTQAVRFTGEDAAALLTRLRAEHGKGIWICGGANVAGQLVAQNLIDCYFITVIPTLLGSGTRLFAQETGEIPLRLVRSQSYNGMTDLVYVRR